MYDPLIARFLQEDSYYGDRNDPLSLNLYTYCHNEPLMYTDPTGHDDVDVITDDGTFTLSDTEDYDSGSYTNIYELIGKLGGKKSEDDEETAYTGEQRV
jgi:hypothetical protein